MLSSSSLNPIPAQVVFGADLYKNPFSRLLMKYISAPALYLTYLLMAVFIIVNLLGW